MNNKDFTSILHEMKQGTPGAADLLFEALHAEIRVAAQALMNRERVDDTLQPSVVVNDAVLNLMESEVLTAPEDRLNLFAAANRVMRQVLVDHARNRNVSQRAHVNQRSALDVVLDTLETRDRTNIIDLTEAMDELRQHSPRQVQITELSFFSGLQHKEIAELLNISTATVKRDSNLAKAKLAGLLAME